MEPREEGRSHSSSLTQAHTRAPASLLRGLEQHLSLLRTTAGREVSEINLQAALDDERWEIRLAAVEAAGADIPPTVILQALQDEHRFVRMAAVCALQKWEAPGRMQLLLAALQDRDWQVREMAVLTLGEMGDASAEAALTGAAHDPNSTVCEAVSLVLEHGRGTQISSATALPPPAAQKTTHQKRQRLMAIAQQPSQPPPDSKQDDRSQLQPPQRRRKVRKGTSFLLLGVAAVLVVLALTAAGFDLGWWNHWFGNPDLYQTIGQQQSSHGVTISVTKVYADEGRTIIAYDIASNDPTKELFVGTFNLTGSLPQKQEPLTGTECDGWHQGLDHCYMLQPAFEAPSSVQTVTITWEVTQILVVQPGSNRNFPPLMGHWHFSFTVPFHHENNHQIPDPLHGEMYITS